MCVCVCFRRIPCVWDRLYSSRHCRLCACLYVWAWTEYWRPSDVWWFAWMRACMLKIARCGIYLVLISLFPSHALHVICCCYSPFVHLVAAKCFPYSISTKQTATNEWTRLFVNGFAYHASRKFSTITFSSPLTNRFVCEIYSQLARIECDWIDLKNVDMWLATIFSALWNRQIYYKIRNNVVQIENDFSVFFSSFFIFSK